MPTAPPALSEQTMRIVLDTDVSSLLLKRTLPPAWLAALAPHEPAISFVTVGELRKWTVVRELGASRLAALDAWVAARPKIPATTDVARKWGEIVGYAERRGRPRPINDSWIAACCLTYDLPLATLNSADFDDFVEYEGLRIISTHS